MVVICIYTYIHVLDASRKPARHDSQVQPVKEQTSVLPEDKAESRNSVDQGSRFYTC